MIEAIKKRTSVRTYLKKALTKDDEEKVIKIIEQVNHIQGPFGHSLDLFFYETPKVGDMKSQIGTYGFIKNYKAFIVGKTVNTFEAMIDFGFVFEHLILKLAYMDLGTCWLGGTFNRGIFDHMRKPNEIIPAITPIGYPSDKKSIREKIIRRAAQGDLRKPFSELFFFENFYQPLDESHPFAHYLDMVRIGPSASNKQPWRCIVEKDIIHFYLQRTKDYGKLLPYDIQALDIGIALCHLISVLKEEQRNFEIIYHKDLNPELDLVRVIAVKILK